MKLIRELACILDAREKIAGAILLCGMVLGAMFEAVSIGLVVPIIAVLKEPRLVFESRVAQPLLTALNIRDLADLTIAIGLGLVCVFMIKSSYLVFLYRWLFYYVYEKHARLTRRMLAGYLGAPYTFHLQRNTAELVKTTTETI